MVGNSKGGRAKCPCNVVNEHSQHMSRSLILSLMNRATNGNELLAVADVIVADIEQENINDCAEYFASISA